VDQSAALSASVTEGAALPTADGLETTHSTEGATATQGAESTVAELDAPAESAEATIAPVHVAETVARQKLSYLADEDGTVHSSS
jgi:hypothetical protein